VNRYRIAVIAGDGVGPEVVPEGIRVLEAVARLDDGFEFAFEEFSWGTGYYLETGRMMPENALDLLREFDAIFLGAVGSPEVPDHVTLWGLLLPIRQRFNQYVNLRPIKLFPGVVSPLRDVGPDDVDMICVRENSEGEYAGVGGRSHVGFAHEVALQTDVFTRAGVTQVARYAFDLARARKGRLASITKSNASPFSYVLWDEIIAEVGSDYPDVEVTRVLVDAAAAYFVTKPQMFDVVVASNLFADILTDIGAAIQGSMGLGASANLNPAGGYPGMFEPIHGSAPDIAGKGIANPLGAVWAGALMLDDLGQREAAATVMEAIAGVLAAGEARTPDLGGASGSQEVTDAVLEALHRPEGRRGAVEEHMMRD
jgi:tartrate dehydrogenase/decarboxylase/D-malate dehydrogenase